MEKIIEFAGKKWRVETKEWRNYGKHRLYINVNDKTEGYIDLQTGKWAYKTNNDDWLAALKKAFEL